MPSVRMAADRAVRVDVDFEGMVALIREAGIPVREEAKPRKITVGAGSEAKELPAE